MTSNPIQDFFSQLRIPFLGDNLMRKYENEKSPLRSELFSTTQLEHYASSLAESHTITNEPAPEQLIKRLFENEEILIEVRNLLIESSHENSPISPAGEWLLDNFFLIEEQIQIGKKHFPKKYSETLPRLTKGPLAGRIVFRPCARQPSDHDIYRMGCHGTFRRRSGRTPRIVHSRTVQRNDRQDCSHPDGQTS